MLEANGWLGHAARPRRRHIFRYASGTSVNPQSLSWRAHWPRFSFETRTRSMGMMAGTSFLEMTLSDDRVHADVAPLVDGLGEQHGRDALSTYTSCEPNASTDAIFTRFGSRSFVSDGVNSAHPPIIAQP